MRNIIGSAMVVTMALSLLSAVLLLGAVSMDVAAPALGLGLLGAVLWAFKLIMARTVSWKHAPTHWPVLAFVLYAVLRYFTSPLEYDSRIEVIQVCFYALIYFVVANNFYHSRDRTILIGIVGILAVFESGYGIWQAATNSETVFLWNRPAYYTGRGSGSYICPNHLAGFLEMALGLLMGRAAFFHGRRGISETDAVRKVLIIYASLMALAGIVASFSRFGGLAAFAGLLALLLWGEGRLQVAWQRIAVLSAIIVLIVGAGLFAPKALDRINRSLVPDHTQGGQSLVWRGQLWNATAHMIAAAPVLGTGPGTWQWFHQLHRYPDLQIHPAYAHSDVLHLLSDYGFIGWLIVVAFFICYFWHVALLTTRKTSSEQRSFAIGGSIAVIAIMAHSWGDFNLHIPANAMLLIIIIGFTAAMDDPRDQFPRTPMKRLPRIALGTAVLLLASGGVWLAGKAAASSWFTDQGNQAKQTLDWKAARALYARAIAIDANNPEPHLQLGETYRLESVWRVDPARRHEREELARQAINSFEAALSRNPFQTQALVRLASAHQLLDDMDTARKTLEQALTVDPKSAFVYHRLGLFYHTLGQEEKAAEAFQKAEELFFTGDDTSRLALEETRPRK